jgi:type VI secretion system protein ImpH
MATASGRTDSDLKASGLAEQLTRTPHRFNFFQAVRLLERAGNLFRVRTKAAGRIGEDEAPQNEVVRFHVPASFSFPPGEIGSFSPPSDDRPARMSVSFLGLIGPAGVLPRHYTQLAIERSRQKDTTLRDFFDLFHHRLIALFYRAWRKFRFFVGYERAAESGQAGNDDFTQALYSLVGLGTPAVRRRQEVDDETWLYYAGQFAHVPKNAISLAAMTSDYLDVPAEIEQFVGQWLYLSRADQSNLPGAQRRQPANNDLGMNVVVGERVWSVEQKFRVRLGPLSYRDFLRYMPRGDRLSRAAQFIRGYVGPEFDFDVQPILRKEEVPRCRLGGEDEPSRLGWNTWLLTQPLPQDARDAIFVNEGWSTR